MRAPAIPALAAGGGDRVAPRRQRGEDELVVVAAGEQALALQRDRLRGEDGAARQGVDVDDGADAGAAQHVAEVAGQAVGDVDRARRHAAQAHAERGARRRQLHRPAHLREGGAVERDRAAERLERQPRVAERAADVEVVAGTRARAQQRRAGRQARRTR